MPICKYCAKPFDWGSLNGKWIPLVGTSDAQGLDRDFVDSNGELRAKHWLVCIDRGGPSVKIAKLVTPIPGDQVIFGGNYERQVVDEAATEDAVDAQAAPKRRRGKKGPRASRR